MGLGAQDNAMALGVKKRESFKRHLKAEITGCGNQLDSILVPPTNITNAKKFR